MAATRRPELLGRGVGCGAVQAGDGRGLWSSLMGGDGGLSEFVDERWQEGVLRRGDGVHDTTARASRNLFLYKDL